MIPPVQLPIISLWITESIYSFRINYHSSSVKKKFHRKRKCIVHLCNLPNFHAPYSGEHSFYDCHKYIIHGYGKWIDKYLKYTFNEQKKYIIPYDRPAFSWLKALYLLLLFDWLKFKISDYRTKLWAYTSAIKRRNERVEIRWFKSFKKINNAEGAILADGSIWLLTFLVSMLTRSNDLTLVYVYLSIESLYLERYGLITAAVCSYKFS